MEPLDLFCCLLEGLDLVAIIADAVAWNRSRPSRQARRAARRAGEAPPEPSGWLVLVAVLTPVAVVLTVLVVVKWARAV